MSGHVTKPEKWQTFSKASLNGSECNLNNTNSRNASITGSITYIVEIGKPERQVREASHCGSKQQQISHAMITLLLLVRATYIWVLFFADIPFVVNRTFNATPTERLQQ